jgi:very-short-patch-repair endonuclease
MKIQFQETNFICSFCGKECKNHNSLINHERLCYSNPNRQDIKSWIHKGPRGERNYKTTGFYGHKHTKGEYHCKFCNRFFEYKHSCTLHEKYCDLNPNKEQVKSHPQTKESREKISATQKENYSNGKSRWNIDRSQTPYDEQYFMEWLDTFTDYEHNFRVNRFYLDFAWPDKKIYFEVNGEQHYQKDINGKDYQLRDKERFEILEKEGWTCLSIIRWSEYKKLSKEDKCSFLEHLKSKILE